MKRELLKHIPNTFETEEKVNPKRIFEINNIKPKKGKIVYLIERNLRLNDNFCLNFALEKGKETEQELVVLHPKINYKVKAKEDFISKETENTKQDFLNAGLDFLIIEETALESYLAKEEISILVTEFNPIKERKYCRNAKFKIYEVDGTNIIPARFTSDKQEYNAKTIRAKIYNKIYEFITETPKKPCKKTNAENALEDFIENKLKYYAEKRNNPTENVTSNLSIYLNLGLLSAQKVATEIIKSKVSNEIKEEFLEELIVRRELSENFCLYCKDFKSQTCTPQWAKNTLQFHAKDHREYLYTKQEFENAKTHDPLWNAAQNELLKTGKIHGYMRMYWAKKILEWSNNPQEAIDIAIYLNDNYAYDAPAPNGYVGILWSIAALHDRAFGERPVIGKIRPMTYNGAKSKFDIQKYITNMR